MQISGLYVQNEIGPHLHSLLPGLLNTYKYLSLSNVLCLIMAVGISNRHQGDTVDFFWPLDYNHR